MNALTLALKEAGVKVPTITQRVWTLLKDQPGLTCRQVIDKLNLKEASTSALLTQLAYRGMVETKIISVMRRVPSGGSAPRRVSLRRGARERLPTEGGLT